MVNSVTIDDSCTINDYLIISSSFCSYTIFFVRMRERLLTLDTIDILFKKSKNCE